MDNFYFIKYGGTDHIGGYEDGSDTLDVRPFNFASGAAAAATAVQVGADVHLNLGSVVILDHTSVAVIDIGDFIIWAG